MGLLIKRELKHLDQLLNLSINLGLVKLQLTGSKGLLVQLQVSHFLSSDFKEWQAQLDLNTEIGLMSCSNI